MRRKQWISRRQKRSTQHRHQLPTHLPPKISMRSLPGWWRKRSKEEIEIDDLPPPRHPLAEEIPADQEAGTPTTIAARTDDPAIATKIATPRKAATTEAAIDPAATIPDETARVITPPTDQRKNRAPPVRNPQRETSRIEGGQRSPTATPTSRQRNISLSLALQMLLYIL